MRIIIVGDGKVGLTLTGMLSREGHDIVVIDKNAAILRNLQESYDVMVVEGNGANHSVLNKAGAATADLLIAATSADEINLLCCITAKKLGCGHTVARVRNPEYVDQLDFLQEELGLSMTINPDFAAANEIFGILQFPSFLNRDKFAKGRVEIVELRVKAGSTLDGISLKDLHQNAKVKVLVCAVERGDGVTIPSGNFVLQAEDKIHVTAQSNNLSRLIDYLGIPMPQMQDVTIIGGSRIGFYLASRLINAGIHVKIIEKDLDRCRWLSERLSKALIINGDASEEQLIHEEIYGKSDALVSLVGIDEINMVISLYAKSIGVSKVISKVDRVGYINTLKMFDGDSVISPKELICNDVLRYVRARCNSEEKAAQSIHRLVDDRVEALEFIVDEDTLHLNIPLTQAPVRKDLLLACIRRRMEVIFPAGTDSLQAGDLVVVIVPADRSINELNDIFTEA